MNEREIGEWLCHLEAGRTEAFLDALADDVAWTVLGQEPTARTTRGKQALSAHPLLYSRRPGAALRLKLTSVIARGAEAALELESSAPEVPLGHQCWRLRMDAGKIVSVRAYLDAASVQQLTAAGTPAQTEVLEPPRLRVAVIGLGNMGRGMAERLRARGFTLQVWNRTPDKASGLGVAPSATLAEAVAGADVVLSSLSDDAAVRGVVLGASGVLSALGEGAVHLGASTVSYVELALATGKALQAPLPVAGVVRDHLIGALARGLERSDWSALTTTLRTLAALPAPA